MTDDKKDSGLHIDDDWKSEAQREKQRLAEQEEKERKTPGQQGLPPASFVELINLLAMQAVIALGGYQGPGGERIPPNHPAAQHHIDLLELLDNKTKGNLTPEEKQVLDAVLHELRMQYVHVVSGAGGAPGGKPTA